MFNIIISFINEFIQEMLKHKYIASLMLFLYVSIIFIIVSVAVLYKDGSKQDVRITFLERS